MEQIKSAFLVASRRRRKIKELSVHGIVKAYPMLRGILSPYWGSIVARVDKLDYISIWEPNLESGEVMPKLIAGARFVGDNEVIRVNSEGKVSTADTHPGDSNRLTPKDICPMRDPVITIVITCVVDQFALLVYEHY